MVQCHRRGTCKNHLKFEKTIINEFEGYFKILYFMNFIYNKHFPTNFLKGICYGKQSLRGYKRMIPYDVECFFSICIFFKILEEQGRFPRSPCTHYAYESFIKIYFSIKKTLICWYHLWLDLVWKDKKWCYHAIS